MEVLCEINFNFASDFIEEKPGRRKREFLEIVVSRSQDLASKRGTSGTPELFQTNYFKLLKRTEWALYQYRIDFTPPIEIPGLRKRLIYEQKAQLGGYIYDTQSTIYLTKKLTNDTTVFAGRDRDENEFEIQCRFVGQIQMTTKESLQVLNLILRRSIEGLKLQLVGRNFFDAAAKIDIKQYNIQLWPGYQTSIRQHEKDILLCAEITNKVMRTETIYDIMHKIIREDNANFKVKFATEVIGMTVLTDYTQKTYRVDDVDWDSSPSDTFDTKEGKVSFIDYYKRKYNIRIRDPKQPMLISKSKEKDLRGGKSEAIALIPELCRATGLSDQMRTNFQ